MMQQSKEPKNYTGAIVLTIVLLLIFIIAANEKKEDKIFDLKISKDKYTCCNCLGSGKITVYGTTVTCSYCVGNGTLSAATNERLCK